MGMGGVEIVVMPDKRDLSGKRDFLETSCGNSLSFKDDL